MEIKALPQFGSNVGAENVVHSLAEFGWMTTKFPPSPRILGQKGNELSDINKLHFILKKVYILAQGVVTPVDVTVISFH